MVLLSLRFIYFQQNKICGHIPCITLLVRHEMIFYLRKMLLSFLFFLCLLLVTRNLNCRLQVQDRLHCWFDFLCFGCSLHNSIYYSANRNLAEMEGKLFIVTATLNLSPTASIIAQLNNIRNLLTIRLEPKKTTVLLHLSSPFALCGWSISYAPCDHGEREIRI